MSIFKTLRRDIGAQFSVSKNLKEGLTTKARRAFWATLYTLKGFFIALRGIGREHIGSQVIYNGETRYISNNAGSEYPTLSSDGFYQQYVPRSQITSVKNYREIRHRFNFGFSFYMGSWHSIDVNKRIYK